MPNINPRKFKTIGELIESFPYLERAETMRLFRHVRSLKEQIDKATLKKICYFKTARSQSKVNANTKANVRKIFTELKNIKNDRQRCAKLCELKGVRIPTASAILMFVQPEKYPVIDIRVWKVLAEFKVVKPKRKWVGFSWADWENYLRIMRTLAANHNVTPRHIDKVLYSWHVLQYELTAE